MSSVQQVSKSKPQTESEGLASVHYQSQVGKLKLFASGLGLCAVLWPEDENSGRVRLEAVQHSDSKVLAQATKQLDSYFSGETKSFDMSLDIQGTDFQKSVWQELTNIPYGSTVSYLDVATAIGSPQSVRAVASAIGKNPLSILVPCHRVVGSDGSLTGFAGGLDAKAKLLDLESRNML